MRKPRTPSSVSAFGSTSNPSFHHYFFTDGRTLELKTSPRVVRVGEGRHAKSQFYLRPPGSELEIEFVPVKGLFNTWAQVGLETTKPKKGDQLFHEGREAGTIMDSTEHESLARPGVFLVQTPIDLSWVRQLAPPLPVWEIVR